MWSKLCFDKDHGSVLSDVAGSAIGAVVDMAADAGKVAEVAADDIL